MKVDSSGGKDRTRAATTLYILHFKQDSEAKANMTITPPDSCVTCGMNSAFRMLPQTNPIGQNMEGDECQQGKSMRMCTCYLLFELEEEDC